MSDIHTPQAWNIWNSKWHHCCEIDNQTDKIENIQFFDEEIKAIVTVASNAGTYVTSHSYTPKAIQQAISLGVMGIEHGNLIDETTARMMAEKGVFLTPTLVTYAAMAMF